MDKANRIAWVVAAAVVIVAVGSTVAYASIPDSSGVIHGCYTKSGALSVVDSATMTCPKGSTSLNWSQTGPAGPAGPAGADGATGPAGPQGPAGPPAGANETRFFATKTFPTGQAPGTSESESVGCPSGQAATGGGFALGGSSDPMVQEKWIPIANNMSNLDTPPDGWNVTLIMTGTSYTAFNLSYQLTAYVLCSPESS